MNDSKLIKNLCRVILTIALCVSGVVGVVGVVYAASVTELEQQIQSLQTNITQGEQELVALKQEMSELLQEEPAITQEYKAVSAELEDAFAKANSDDTAAHKNAMVVSFKFNRLDRKHTRFLDRKQEVADSIQGLSEKLTEWQAELAATRKQLQQAQEQAKVLAAQQAKQQQAQLIAEQQKASQAAAAAATAAAGIAVVEKQAATKAQPAIAAGWPGLKDPKPEQIAYAKQELERLKGLSSDNPPFREVEFEPKCGDEVDLSYQGGKIYSAVVSLEAGMCQIEIFRDDFWLQLPQSTYYRVIYDVNSISSPKLYLFEERLLR